MLFHHVLAPFITIFLLSNSLSKSQYTFQLFWVNTDASHANLEQSFSNIIQKYCPNLFAFHLRTLRQCWFWYKIGNHSKEDNTSKKLHHCRNNNQLQRKHKWAMKQRLGNCNQNETDKIQITQRLPFKNPMEFIAL